MFFGRLSPELLRRQARAFRHRLKLGPHYGWVNLRVIRGLRRKAAVRTGDDVFPADQFGESCDALGDELGVFDDVARMLGAGPNALARTIHLPLARPAIWGASLLIFVDCLKELPATLLLRPLNTETLATYIYQFATRGNFEEGSLAALIIVAVGIVPIMYITRRATLGSMMRNRP